LEKWYLRQPKDREWGISLDGKVVKKKVSGGGKDDPKIENDWRRLEKSTYFFQDVILLLAWNSRWNSGETSNSR